VLNLCNQLITSIGVLALTDEVSHEGNEWCRQALPLA
jgi:hypothetical protein